MKFNKSRAIALAMAAAMLFGACTAKTNDTPSASPTPSSEATPTEQLRQGEIVLRLADASTVTTYNPHTATSAQEYAQLQWVNAYLYKRILDENTLNSVFVAEYADGDPIQMDDQMKVWQIKIQKGFTFENGDPIDAKAFIYSFKMLLDPKLASRNYNMMYSLAGGEKYYTGVDTNFENVGIKALDDYTIEITFEDAYLPEKVNDIREWLAFVGCGAVNEAMFESCFNADRSENSYGTTLDKFVAAGAYKPVKLIDGQYMEYEKRTGKSPFADTVFVPDRITVAVVADANTRIQMYENGEIDTCTANLPAYAEDPNAYYSYTPDNYGLFINSMSETQPILKDPNMRYALYWGLDREKIVKACYPTNRPNPYHLHNMCMVPNPANPDENINYRQTAEAKGVRFDGHELTESGYDAALALEYFNKAYDANGGKKVSVEVQYVENNDTAKAWAEAIQQNYQDLFGNDRFEIVLRAIPSAVVYENLNRENLKYEVLAAGGIYQNIEKTWDNSNWVYSGTDVYSTQYTVISSEAIRNEWDDLFYKSCYYDYKGKPAEQIKAGARMEELLMEECSFIPAYSRGNRVLINENIEPLVEVGDPYLEFALLQARYY